MQLAIIVLAHPKNKIIECSGVKLISQFTVFYQLDVSAPSGILIDTSISVVISLSLFRQKALSHMYVSNALTISILKQSGSNLFPHLPTGRLFI
jgi:hypothetical protein